MHELRITNQVMYLSPPLEDVRVCLIDELTAWEANVIGLSRISHARYQVSRTYQITVLHKYLSIALFILFRSLIKTKKLLADQRKNWCRVTNAPPQKQRKTHYGVANPEFFFYED